MKTSTKIIIVVAVVLVVGLVAYYFYSKNKAKKAPAEAEKKAVEKALSEGEKELAKGIEKGDLIVVETPTREEKLQVLTTGGAMPPASKTPLIQVKDKKTVTVKK